MVVGLDEQQLAHVVMSTDVTTDCCNPFHICYVSLCITRGLVQTLPAHGSQGRLQPCTGKEQLLIGAEVRGS